ncbi:transmembrane protein 138-like [Saccostrea cucullata]|uniref:transmembrane protein 138-like n=1 Tax=Saccostrea cuccullata TaxID=36930 RepID=UPI002ED12729
MNITQLSKISFLNSIQDLCILFVYITQLSSISILYSIQDVCILFAVIVVFLLFFNTYIFQAGLVNILIEKFKVAIGITFIYFGLNVGLHVWEMTLRWDEPNLYIWGTPGFIPLFVIQRTGAVLYYYFKTFIQKTSTRCNF